MELGEEVKKEEGGKKKRTKKTPGEETLMSPRDKSIQGEGEEDGFGALGKSLFKS